MVTPLLNHFFNKNITPSYPALSFLKYLDKPILKFKKLSSYMKIKYKLVTLYVITINLS
jgi:hypothetical protein